MQIETRNPVALAGAHRAGNIELLGSLLDTRQHSPKPIDLQASRLRERYQISWALARITAERLVRHLERSGFVLMKAPPAAPPTTTDAPKPPGA